MLISVCLIKDFDSSIITNAEVTMMSVFLSQQRRRIGGPAGLCRVLLSFLQRPQTFPLSLLFLFSPVPSQRAK